MSENMEVLTQLRAIAQRKAVSFQIQYSESEDNWYGDVDSPAPAERREWKKYSRLPDLVAAMTQWMESL